ncbi:MAG: zinc-ribbon domain-containing protein [Pseudomonadota bacterium]|nr:zinc-ribbon domain-containing protein [Pseudomonadota bacterium]
MIVQCRLCRTKYRFDETLLGLEGAWVRCVRCQNVFFQHPPLSTPPQASHPEAVAGGEGHGLASGAGSEGEAAAGDEGHGLASGATSSRETPPLADGAAARREEAETPGASALNDDLIREVAGKPVGLYAQPREDREEKAVAASGRAKRFRAWALGLIVLILAAVGGSLLVFPEYARMVMGELNVLLPGLGWKTTPAETPAAVGPAQVRIAEVRQRFVDNPLLGRLRVVEGLAMNASPYPMTRIKIRGELHDLVGVVVKDADSFCGNLLTDEELAIMSEEQIFRELAIPQGSDVPNDRIGPQGTIPFMLVFIREPAGVDKAMVMPVAAERLLSP